MKKQIDSQTTHVERLIKLIEDYMYKCSFLEIDHTRWYIGITNDVVRRKKEHERKYQKELKYFKSFYAHSFKNASEIENTIGIKGTVNKEGSRGATADSKWVYVYKVRPTVLD